LSCNVADRPDTAGAATTAQVMPSLIDAKTDDVGEVVRSHVGSESLISAESKVGPSRDFPEEPRGYT